MHYSIRSQIANKISKKMLRIYIAIYFFILILLLLFITPALYNATIDRTMQTLDSMATEYELLQQTMEETLDRYYLSSELEQYLTLFGKNPSDSNRGKIILALGKIASSNSRLFAACIDDGNGNCISSYNHSTVDKESIFKQYSAYQELYEHQHGAFFSPIISNVFQDDTSYQDCFFYSEKITLGSHPYIATIFYNASSFIKQFHSLYRISFSEFSILNHKYETLYQSDYTFDQKIILEKVDETYNTRGHFTYGNGLLFYQIIPSSACMVIGYAPYLDLFQTPISLIAIITLLYALSPVLYGFLLHPITSRQLEPLKHLSDAMQKYNAGDTIQMDFHTNDEIQTIGEAFNGMVTDIAQSIEEIKNREHQNAVISYKLLATQVDPHFIYNTMNVINIMAQDGKTNEVVEINSALIRILRERLNSKISVFDTIQNELDTLMQYICIINYRYQNNISMRFDIDESLFPKWIPKNILQPLVENAFFHGFSNQPKTDSGNIDIMIYSMDDEMTIEVSDNGSGMTEHRINQIMNDAVDIYHDQKPHIGINNIRQRLSYLYPGQHEFLIQSSLNYGTTIIITIPKLDNPPEFKI